MTLCDECELPLPEVPGWGDGANECSCRQPRPSRTGQEELRR